MEAMLGALENMRGYAAIRKRLGALVEDGKTAIEAPAPATVQARAERQVVYKEKKKIIREYLPLIASARQADSLNFSYEVPLRQSKAALVGKFEPQTEMEKAVHDLLVHAKADKEAAVEEAEDDDLGARGFTAEQVKIRRAELAKMRALLFYEQQKRYKANKIKSKAYHRIRKRQRLRQEDASREALRAVDPEAARDLDEKDALARAQERMSLRHKNTSKWAKHVMRQGTGHTQVETRKAVAEQLQLGEELRKKAGGKGSSDEEEEDDDEDLSDMDEEQRNALIRQRAAGKVKTLLGEVVDDGQEATGANKGGLMGMKFMTRAVERQRARAQEEVEAVLRELENEEGEGDSSSDEEYDEGKKREAKLNNKGPDTRAAEEDDGEEGQGGGAEGAKSMHQLLEGSLQTAGTRWGGQGGRKMRVSGPITVKIITATADEKEEEGQEEEKEEEEMVAMQEEYEGVDEQQQVSRTDRCPSSFVMETRQTRSSVTTTASSLAAAGGGGGRLQQQSQVQEEEDEEEEERDADGILINPWMTSTTSTASEIRRRQKTKGGAASSQVLDIQRAVEVVTGTSASSSTNKKQEKKGGKGSRGAAAGGEIEDCEEREEEEQEEDEEANTGLVIRGKQQEELVRRAFASVDTEGDFLKDKEESIEEEEVEKERQLQQQQGKKGGNGPRKGAASMVAGWGSWAGMGAAEPAGPSPVPSWSKNCGFGARFSKGGAPAAAASFSSNHTSTKGGGGGNAASTHIDKGLQKPRLDRNLPTVVINERRMKKAAGLKVAQVPYPFTSRAQYEASLRRPVGKEWNTMTSVREQTRPAVKVRPGTVVQPIKLRKTHKAVFPTSSS